MPNSLAIVIEKLEHYQFVNSEFSLRAHLIDPRTNGPKIGEKLQLKVLLMFEELPSDATTYKEYHPNLIEVVRNEGIQAEDGTADIRLKLKEVSMAHDDRRFVICLQAYQSGAGNNLISAHSNPVTCIRHKLVVFEDPNSKNKLLINDDGQGGYMWYKDEGAKDKCIEMVVQLVDCNNNLVVDRIVPLSVSLTYSSGQLVHPQNVLVLFPERNIFIGNSGYEIIRFRVNEVSRNHRKQNFQIFVAPDITSSPSSGDVSPACSVDFEVKSKRTADARNKSQSVQQSQLYHSTPGTYGSADYGVGMSTNVMYQKIDEDYSHMPGYTHTSTSSSNTAAAAALDVSPYVYVKSDYSSSTAGVSAPATLDYSGSKRKLNELASNGIPASTSSIPLSSNNGGSGYSSSGGFASGYPSVGGAPSGTSSSSNSLLSAGGEDVAYFPIAVPPSTSTAGAISSVVTSSTSSGSLPSSGIKPAVPFVPYPASSGLKLPAAKYPRMEDFATNVDHHLWNEQCSGYAVEAVKEIDAWSKTVLQLVDDLLSQSQSSSNSIHDAALKIKMKFATDVVSGIGCLQSYCSYQHQYNLNHSKLLQTLQYQFPGGSVTGAGPTVGGVPPYSSYPAVYSATGYPTGTPVLSAYFGSSGAGIGGATGAGVSGYNTSVGPATNYLSVVSSQSVVSAEEAMVQAILVMKSVVVQLHDELDSTTDVGVPAFDHSFTLIGFYKANENYMLFRKSDKLEPLLSEMQKSQIKAELIDAIKTKSKFLFDLSGGFSSLAEMKNAALAAIIAKAKAEKDLIDAVSLMENLRKPYLG